MPVKSLLIALSGALLLSLGVDVGAEGAEKKFNFKTHRIGTYRGESCGVGDFNGDGRLDISALPYLYLAPEFAPVKICEVQGEVDEEGNGYRWDFMNAPLDVDKDGRLDIVTCSWFGKKAEWLRNPGPEGGEWARHLVEENGNYECGDLWDVDGDGKQEEILPMVKGTCWYEAGLREDGQRGVIKHVISEEEMDFGGGCGDINGDGRPDVLRPAGWYEAPADPRKGVWKKHPWTMGHTDPAKPGHTPQMNVYDVNGDGLNDVITSIAHGYGIFWYEQGRDGENDTWTRHLIDDSWSQPHSFGLADMDGDGDLDFVTGKRFKAHNGNDPGGMEPPGVYLYELDRTDGVRWIKHVISFDEGIGSGLNLVIEDLDGDKDWDIIVTGKWGGPAWFENLAR